MRNCLYILLCSNGRYYVGSTIELQNRLQDHAVGRVKSTKNIRPVKLVFSQDFLTVKEARTAEYWLKSLKSRRIIEEIISSGIINKKLSC